MTFQLCFVSSFCFCSWLLKIILRLKYIINKFVLHNSHRLSKISLRDFHRPKFRLSIEVFFGMIYVVEV